MQEPTRRFTRQTAVRIFAQEYQEASLLEEGSGEYDPSFVITKLGAKINRALVCGVIDRMERREGDSGPNYSGHIRDPTGSYLFTVASFQPEMHPDFEELMARFESGDRFLLALVGKARWFETDDGGVFTSLRAEEFTVIDRECYTSWLVETAEATLRRIDAHSASLESDLTPAALEAAGVPSDLVDGLILARGHYGEFDPENYRLGVLQALSMATGRTAVMEESEPAVPPPTLDEAVSHTQEPQPSPSDPPGDALPLILDTIRSQDAGEGVEYGNVVHALVQSGHSRESAEDAIDDARDQGEVMEPRFGYFQIVPE
jgi:RPA family protein